MRVAKNGRERIALIVSIILNLNYNRIKLIYLHFKISHISALCSSTMVYSPIFTYYLYVFTFGLVSNLIEDALDMFLDDVYPLIDISCT